MCPVQTFWRYHAKPPSLPRVRHTVAHPPPDPGSVAHVRQLMKAITEAATAAGTPRPLFPFEAGDVAATYTDKRETGDGLWFALRDGRVFRGDGEPDTNDAGVYSNA